VPNPAASHKKEKLWKSTEGLVMDDNDLYTLIKGEGATRDQAISQLRTILLRGLSKSLNNRY
jgi:hypothetical protein